MTSTTSLTKGSFQALHMLLEAHILMALLGHTLLNMVIPHRDIRHKDIHNKDIHNKGDIRHRGGIRHREDTRHKGDIHHKDILLVHTHQRVTPVHLLHTTQGMDLAEWGLCSLGVLQQLLPPMVLLTWDMVVMAVMLVMLLRSCMVLMGMEASLSMVSLESMGSMESSERGSMECMECMEAASIRNGSDLDFGITACSSHI